MFELASSFLGSNNQSGILTTVNSFWGSFTGTPASVFNEAGEKYVAEVQTKFENTVNQNPSLALTNLSKDLNFGVAKFSLALKNASQKKTIEGNKKSMEYVKSSLSILSNLEKKLPYKFSKKSITLNHVDRKYNENYSYNEYTVVGKNDVANFEDSTSNFTTSNKTENTNKSFIYIILGAVIFFFMKNKKRRY